VQINTLAKRMCWL